MDLTPGRKLRKNSQLFSILPPTIGHFFAKKVSFFCHIALPRKVLNWGRIRFSFFEPSKNDPFWVIFGGVPLRGPKSAQKCTFWTSVAPSAPKYRLGPIGGGPPLGGVPWGEYQGRSPTLIFEPGPSPITIISLYLGGEAANREAIPNRYIRHRRIYRLDSSPDPRCPPQAV